MSEKKEEGMFGGLFSSLASVANGITESLGLSESSSNEVDPKELDLEKGEGNYSPSSEIEPSEVNIEIEDERSKDKKDEEVVDSKDEKDEEVVDSSEVVVEMEKLPKDKKDEEVVDSKGKEEDDSKDEEKDLVVDPKDKKEDLEKSVETELSLLHNASVAQLGFSDTDALIKALETAIEREIETGAEKYHINLEFRKEELVKLLVYKIVHKDINTKKEKLSKEDFFENTVPERVNAFMKTYAKSDLEDTKKQIGDKLTSEDPITQQRNKFLHLCNTLHKNYVGVLKMTRDKFGKVLLEQDQYSVTISVAQKEKAIMGIREQLQDEKSNIIYIFDSLEDAARTFQSDISKKAQKYQDSAASRTFWSNVVKSTVTGIGGLIGVGGIAVTVLEHLGVELPDVGASKDPSKAHTISGTLTDSNKRESTFVADVGSIASSIATTTLGISSAGVCINLITSFIGSVSDTCIARANQNEPVVALQGAARLLIELIAGTRASVEKNLEEAYKHFEKDTKLWIVTLMDNASEYQKKLRHQETMQVQNKLLLEKERKHLSEINKEIRQLEKEADESEEAVEGLGGKVGGEGEHKDKERGDALLDVLETDKDLWKLEGEKAILRALLDKLGIEKLNSRGEIRVMLRHLRTKLEIKELTVQQKAYKKDISTLEEKASSSKLELEQLVSNANKPVEEKAVTVNSVSVSKAQASYLEKEGLQVISVKGDGRCTFGSIAYGLGKKTDAVKERVLNAILDYSDQSKDIQNAIAELIDFGEEGATEDNLTKFANDLLNDDWQADTYDKVPKLVAIVEKLHLTIIKEDGKTEEYNEDSTAVTILLYKGHYSGIEKEAKED